MCLECRRLGVLGGDHRAAIARSFSTDDEAARRPPDGSGARGAPRWCGRALRRPSGIATPPSSSRSPCSAASWCWPRRRSCSPCSSCIAGQRQRARLAGTEESFNETLADHRNGTLTTFSEIGSQVGGAPVLPILVGLIASRAVLRRWLIAAFAVFVLLAESATYRITSIVVSPRPTVSPPAGRSTGRRQLSSGHTAASVAVYSGLVLLLTTRTSSLSKALAWTGAILLTTFVALSRMYQGMHHPTSPAACSSASGRSWCCCSPAARPARPRRGAHETGGRRACRQDGRRRAPGAAAHAPAGVSAPLGSRCRRASGRRARSSGRWRTAPI